MKYGTHTHTDSRPLIHLYMMIALVRHLTSLHIVAFVVAVAQVVVAAAARCCYSATHFYNQRRHC